MLLVVDYKWHKSDMLMGRRVQPFAAAQHQNFLKACDEMGLDFIQIGIGMWDWDHDVA